MLVEDEKRKIQEQLDKVLNGIYQDISQDIQKGMRPSYVIDRITTLTVNKVAPQSKILLTSAFNMMMKRTLSEQYFSNPQHETEFYELRLLKTITSKFDFTVPQKIDYQKDQSTIKALSASGAVIVVGGIVSITMTTWIPVGIAAVLAGIMAYVIKSKSATSNDNIKQIVNDYLQSVSQSFMLWIDSVESFYDDKVKELKNRG